MPAIERMITETSDLAKRYFGNNFYDGCSYGYFWNGSSCQYSSWLSWGRWVLTVVLIVLAFIIFASASGVQARRRRRAGRQPMYGTAWMAPPSYDQSQNQYGGNNSYQMSSNQEAYAPPAYPPPAGNAAGARETQYQPPASPPPTKNKY